jgi:hypothetical protein
VTTFLRVLADKDKATNLLTSCTALRAEGNDARVFQVAPESFRSVPGAPFAYWVNETVRQLFKKIPALESDYRTTKQGLASADDFRFVHVWWEGEHDGWFGFAKGGAFSPFYSDVYLQVNWSQSGAQIKNNLNDKGGVRSNVWMLRDTANNFFGRPGLTWPRRTNGLSFRIMPQGCIFADKGPAVFAADDAPDALLALCALINSQAFGLLVSVQLARVELAQSFEVGLIQQTPIPNLTADEKATLAALARRAWSLKRTLDTIQETSHAFVLPAALRARLGDYHPHFLETELARIQTKIDGIAFDLYGFGEADRIAVQASQGAAGEDEADDDGDEEESAAPIDQTTGLLSWAVGVAFGRFDWRLAIGERAAPAEPEPFVPLPAQSPGMLPSGAAPFHAHSSILVDDSGHLHDLARLGEEVLARVDVPVPDDLRRWLQRDFFALHLKLYSKSRRKAPIYWPLSTASGSYTLWLYYPSLTSQTLYSAINDFVEPKLAYVVQETTALRAKGSARSREEEKSLEALSSLEVELIDLRDQLQAVAPQYRPNHDDGVQIAAAPLWPLFRHKPWQKLLKETWAKLQKGDYDWAHLAMNYWPDRVREKCKTDKSLAIAHGLEDLYVEPEAAPKKAMGRKKKEEAE